MDFFKNLKANTERINKMKIQVAKFQNRIQWKSNAICSGLDEMVQAAHKGMDCGLERTNQLMPDCGFHDWVKFCYIHTKLYNRDRPAGAGEMLCIIRMVLFFIVNFICVLFTALNNRSCWSLFIIIVTIKLPV